MIASEYTLCETPEGTVLDWVAPSSMSDAQAATQADQAERVLFGLNDAVGERRFATLIVFNREPANG